MTKQLGGLQPTDPPTDTDLWAFELGKAGLTEEAVQRGPRQAGDKQALDSRGGLRTLNPS